MNKIVAAAMFTMLMVVAPDAHALTNRERQFAQEARAYFVKAKEQAAEQQRVIEDQDKELAHLDQTALGQQNQIVALSDQIDTAHKNEQAAVAWRNKYEPVIEQVNKYWGLGAFAYGAKVLARHLLILVAVLGVAALAVFVLSFFFPVIGVFFKAAWALISRLFKRK